MFSRWRGAVTPARFRWFALADFVAMILIVLSGAAVRLSGSGLGCPDWPACSGTKITGPDGYHSVIEFANRMVTVALVILVAASVIAAIMRTPRRRDLIVLSGALVGGVIADALLGALVVYSKLNPYLVACHMILSLAMVVIGATLYHRSKYLYGRDASAITRDPHFALVARALWIPLFLVVAAGTIATGAGPHAGGSQGQITARRVDLGFSQAVWIHSVAATFFVALVLGLLAAVWRTGAPAPLKLGVRRLAVISLVQAAIGVSQYFTHVPVLLVELHIAGAISLTIGVTQFNVRQIAREREPGTKRAT